MVETHGRPFFYVTTLHLSTAAAVVRTRWTAEHASKGPSRPVRHALHGTSQACLVAFAARGPQQVVVHAESPKPACHGCGPCRRATFPKPLAENPRRRLPQRTRRQTAGPKTSLASDLSVVITTCFFVTTRLNRNFDQRDFAQGCYTPCVMCTLNFRARAYRKDMC